MIDKLYKLAYEDTDTGVQSKLDSTSTVQGNIQASSAYEDAVYYLAGYIGATKNSNGKFPNLTITIPNDNYYVRFVDPIVEQIVLAKYSSDGIGMTKQEAGAVTDLTSMFTDVNITTLEDIKNFTNPVIKADKILNLSSTILDEVYGDDQDYIDRGWRADRGLWFRSAHLSKVSLADSQYTLNQSMLYTQNSRTYIQIDDVELNNATFIATQQYSNPCLWNSVFFNNLVDGWNDALIPKQTSFINHLSNYDSYVSLFNSCNIQKAIFREGITEIQEIFKGCNVWYVEYPTTITNIGQIGLSQFRRDSQSYWGTQNYTGCIVFKSVNPPTATNTDISHARLPAHIYVPDNSVEVYKNAEGTWSVSTIQSLITPMSQMTEIERAAGTVTDADINRT